MRTIVFGVYIGAPPILGNYYIGDCKRLRVWLSGSTRGVRETGKLVSPLTKWKQSFRN